MSKSDIVDGLSALRSITKAMMNPSLVEAARKNALREEFNGVIVDTCIGFDTGLWETGIQIDDAAWIITQQYPNRDKAIIGHQKHIEMLKKDKKAKLPNLQVEGSFNWG